MDLIRKWVRWTSYQSLRMQKKSVRGFLIKFLDILYNVYFFQFHKLMNFGLLIRRCWEFCVRKFLSDETFIIFYEIKIVFTKSSFGFMASRFPEKQLLTSSRFRKKFVCRYFSTDLANGLDSSPKIPKPTDTNTRFSYIIKPDDKSVMYTTPE